MANPKLSKLSVEALMDLSKQVDQALLGHRATVQKQLDRLEGEGSMPARSLGRTRKSTLKGTKVPPKYRDSAGNTWAGRGAKSRWLVAAMKGGKKLEAFLIDKSARKAGRKKRKAKR